MIYIYIYIPYTYSNTCIFLLYCVYISPSIVSSLFQTMAHDTVPATKQKSVSKYWFTTKLLQQLWYCYCNTVVFFIINATSWNTSLLPIMFSNSMFQIGSSIYDIFVWESLFMFYRYCIQSVGGKTWTRKGQ